MRFLLNLAMFSSKLLNCLSLASMRLGRSIFLRLRIEEQKHVEMNGKRLFADVIPPTIIFGGFCLDFRELNIKDYRIQGSTLERTHTKVAI